MVCRNCQLQPFLQQHYTSDGYGHSKTANGKTPTTKRATANGKTPTARTAAANCKTVVGVIPRTRSRDHINYRAIASRLTDMILTKKDMRRRIMLINRFSTFWSLYGEHRGVAMTGSDFKYAANNAYVPPRGQKYGKSVRNTKTTRFH